jgi:hypothetical protein
MAENGIDMDQCRLPQRKKALEKMLPSKMGNRRGERTVVSLPESGVCSGEEVRVEWRLVELSWSTDAGAAGLIFGVATFMEE